MSPMDCVWSECAIILCTIALSITLYYTVNIVIYIERTISARESSICGCFCIIKTQQKEKANTDTHSDSWLWGGVFCNQSRSDCAWSQAWSESDWRYNTNYSLQIIVMAV